MNNILLTVPNIVKQHVGRFFSEVKLNSGLMFGAAFAGFVSDFLKMTASGLLSQK